MLLIERVSVLGENGEPMGHLDSLIKLSENEGADTYAAYMNDTHTMRMSMGWE